MLHQSVGERATVSVTKTTENQTDSRGEKPNTVQEGRVPFLHTRLSIRMEKATPKEKNGKASLSRTKEMCSNDGFPVPVRHGLFFLQEGSVLWSGGSRELSSRPCSRAPWHLRVTTCGFMLQPRKLPGPLEWWLLLAPVPSFLSFPNY